MGLRTLLLAIVCSVLSIGATNSTTKGEVKHTVYLNHPGISLDETVKSTLVQVLNDEGQSQLFYMDVKSVVCGNSLCKVENVRIFWNDLGQYQKLELNPGVRLEKAEGQPFTKSDYRKLDKILAQKSSSLNEVIKEEITAKGSADSVDAMTGATVLLNKSDYVEGAVWTCYTLWHWVNGGISNQIRKITGQGFSIDQLKVKLQHEKVEWQLFALEQLISHNNYDRTTITMILDLKDTENYDLMKLIISYAEEAASSIYFSTILDLLDSQNQTLRLNCLNSLIKYEGYILNDLFFKLEKLLRASNNYPEIKLFLNLIENRNINDSVLNDKLAIMLENKDLIISRSIYWFLHGKLYSDTTEKKIRDYYSANKGNL